MPKSVKPKWPKKSRAFVVTDWNLNEKEDYERMLGKSTITFIAWGLESCPKTGTEHNQTFLYWKNPVSTSKKALNTMGGMFGEKHCFVEPMLGSFQDNEKYCSKEGKLNKVGKEPRQGYRGDLIEIKNMVLAGEMTSDDLCMGDPMTFHMYGRTVERLETIHLRSKFRTEMTQGIWIWGPSGVGKSHKAFEGFDPKTHYLKPLEDIWWDGYSGQEIVIFNEFRGQIPFAELLALADKWPHFVKKRGREPVPFLAKKLIITSVKHPRDIYVRQDPNEPWQQFERRFQVEHLEQK